MEDSSQEYWVLLRGLARQSGHWASFPLSLETAIPFCRVVVLDLPGSGSQYLTTSPSSIFEITQIVHNQFLKLNPRLEKGTLVLFGLSLGSLVALEWAKRWPEECKGMVLCNGSSRDSAPLYRRMRPSAFFKILWAALIPWIRWREAIIFRLTCNRQSDQKEAVHRWTKLQEEQPMARGTVLRQLYAAARYVIGHPKLEVPILILASRRDRLVHHGCSQAMAQLLGASYREHSWGGHDLPHDDPEWILNQWKEWVRALSSEVKERGIRS